MNKKFLSVILFGALMTATTSTFTSCKDYDDDIDNLQEQLDKKATAEDLNSKVSALESEIAAAKSSAEDAAKKAQEALDKATGAGTVTDADLEALKTDLEAKIAKLAALKDVEEQIANLKSELTNAIAGKASQEELKALAEKVAKLQNEALNLIGRQLTSLVFKPDFYYQGIEAMSASTFAYNALTLKVVNADADFSKDAATIAATLSYLTPGLTADYHMNPSTVDINNIAELTFISDDKKYTKAAGAVVKAEVIGKSLAPNQPGVLRVKAKLTDGNIKDIDKDGLVTVLALQAHYKDAKVDTIITSDYAAVKAQEIKDLVLANAKVQPNHADGEGHLYTTAAEAIQNEPQIQVAWNSEGVDVAEYIQTHYTTTTNKDIAWDKNANEGLVEKDGFKYIYELVGYFAGQNETSESAHANWKGAILRPQITKGGKQQAFGAEQSKATIGRMPLIRVILKDTVQNQNVAVGYIKAEITTTPEENEITVIDPFNFTEGYTVNCSEDNLIKKLTWDQVEEQILAKLDISKEEFENTYKLDATDSDAKQFTGASADAVEVAKKIGVVSKTTADTEGHMTEVLQWTIGANDAYELFTEKASINAVVRFVKENSNKTAHYVYVTFNWTPSPRNVTPAGTIANTTKLDYAWFASDSTEAKSGYDEIHQNVKVPNKGEGADKCTYVNDLLNVFEGNKVTISGVDAVYADFQDNKLTKTFQFVTPRIKDVYGVSKHNKYRLSVSTDGLTLSATKLENNQPTGASQKIAVISNTAVTYQETDYAKDILNYAGRTEMKDGETLCGRVKVVATNECKKDLKLSNYEFDVKFIRPINVTSKDNEGLKDAINDGDKLDFSKVLAFTDWRNNKEQNEFSPEGYNYYIYYGVEKIEVDEANITTNLNGGTLGETLLSSKSNKIKITYTPSTEPIDGTHMGILNYKNNGNEVGSYQIQVPVKVTYKWGVIEVNIVIDVHGTV
ncbi:hypothetical protein [Bacteroides uniformis]|uniref:hypothetical protein n=1 Tax=Bacteroides uniformis TaxID=820 RepID=UPI000E4889FE|nr:hypothetical protein [Bacteroides uniformis]RHC02262.1 hypothetical protein DW861_14195 [Bacteroides uniformis]